MTVTVDGTLGVTTPSVQIINGGTVNIITPSTVAGTHNQILPSGNGYLLLSATNLVFPSSAGTNGQVLSTDGSGALSWVNNDSGLTVGTTAIVTGTTNSLLYDNGGILGEITMGTGVAGALSVAAGTPNGFSVLSPSGFLSIAQGGTGASTASAAANNLLPAQTAPLAGYVLSTDGAGNLSWVSNSAALAIGTPITNGSAANSLLISSGTNILAQIAMGSGVAVALAAATNSAGGFPVLNGSGATPISQGGTGATTAAGAANNILPAQSAPAGKVLASDGAGNLSWVSNSAQLDVGTPINLGTANSILIENGSNNLGEIVMGTGVAAALALATNNAGGFPVLNGSGVTPVAQGGTGLSSGTSGGVPYYSASGTIASSGALAANSLVIGGGAGSAPSTTTTGTGVISAIGNAVNTTGGLPTLVSTLTAGSIVFSNGTALNQDNANLFWDDTNNRLGIGNAAPAHPLDVTGNVKATTFNKVTITEPATGSTLTIADGKTATVNNSITFAGTDSTTMTFPPASASVGYLNIPLNVPGTSYTAVASDSGKCIACTAGGTVTIPSGATFTPAAGTVITVVNVSGAPATIACATTMYQAGTGAVGSRTLASSGIATVFCIDGTNWIINGAGLT
jgi:hypothetical protein